MKFNFVYITTNLINGKQYIGDHSTDDLNSSKTRNYIGSGKPYLQNAKKVYGKQNFKRDILEFFSSKKEAFDAQEKYILKYNTLTPNGYNISPKGGTQCSGGMSEKGKSSISKAQKGKIGYNRNKKFSKEHKQKIGDANKIALKGKILTQEHKNNIGLGNLGKKHSEESKQKMRKPKLKTLNKYKNNSL